MAGEHPSSNYPQSEDYLRILSRFPAYAERGWRSGADGLSYFGDPSHEENGLRTMGNVVFAYALLASLPDGTIPSPAVARDRLLERARAGLKYMVRGHLTGPVTCADGSKWGNAWQSAWWVAKMALGARLIWSELSDEERQSVERVVTFEADRHLDRVVPTGLAEDTKAEENAWDNEALAAALGLFPGHAHRDRWRDKLIEFGVNTLSCPQDRESAQMVDGRRLKDRVYTCNLHSDFTLENHGAYHFCYVASPLQSVAWSAWALEGAGVPCPEGLFHHVEDLWRRVKPTFLDNRFAYVSGKDWARYTYGLYFIVPAMVLVEARWGDPDARAVECARMEVLEAEQRENGDGSFFGARVTRNQFYGQSAKYETDCYASLGLAFLLHRHHRPRVEATPRRELQERLRGQHVSPESGVAFARSPELFASFSKRTLAESTPIALFVPIGDDSLAEWQPGNLLGSVDTGCRTLAVSVLSMALLEDGFLIEGTFGFRDLSGRPLYDQKLRYEVRTRLRQAKVETRYISRTRLKVRSIRGLTLSVGNDRFNQYSRRILSDTGETASVFTPSASNWGRNRTTLVRRILSKAVRVLDWGTREIPVGRRWVNIDNRLGVVHGASTPPGEFVLRQVPYRNVEDGSLHFDSMCSPILGARTWHPGEEMLQSRFVLLAGTAEETRDLARDGPR